MKKRNLLFLSAILLGSAPLLALHATRAQEEAAQIDGAAAPIGTVATGTPKQRIAPEVAPRLVVLPDTRPIEPGHGTHAVGSFQPAGYVEAAPEGLTASPVWQAAAAGGTVYTLELQSPKAKALRIRMRGPASNELELRVYDPGSGSTFGPYSMDRLRNGEDWWTTIMFGDQIGLEFRAYDTEGVEPRLPEINGIAYISVVPDVIGGVPEALACTHRDVSCEAAWLDEANAVTMLSVVLGGNVVGFCSGALLNRSGSDLAPLVATANHCLGDQASANSASYVWLFQTPSCNGAAPNPNNLPRSDGSLLLKRATGSDYNLVGLYEDQGGGFFLGWDNSFWSNGSGATGIHHPGGTFKRISFGSKFGQTDNQTFCDSNGQNCFEADEWNIDYTTGFTQPGSSGSPVMDSSARVRGALSGGPADCTISQYGRFDLAFPNLRYFLFEMANPSFVDGAVGGDPGNNGSSERGTVANPFNTVYEASFAVPAGGTLMITPDSYNERFTIRRPMTLQRSGSSGTVVIGQ